MKCRNPTGVVHGNARTHTVDNLAIVIMAAGKGTRLKSRRPKVLHEIGGKPLLAHVIGAAAKIAPPASIFAVIGHQAETVKSAVASTGIHFVVQPEQRGTGHAIQCAEDTIAGYDNILVLSGDAPLITPETLAALVAFHQFHNAAMTILTAEPANPRAMAASSIPAPIPPEVDASRRAENAHPRAGQSMPEVNSGIYAFQHRPAPRSISTKLTTDNPHGELYLTDMARLLRAAGERVVAIKTADPDELLGANTIAEMMALDATCAPPPPIASWPPASPSSAPKPASSTPSSKSLPTPSSSPSFSSSAAPASAPTAASALTPSSRTAPSARTSSSAKLHPRLTAPVADGARIGPFAHLRPGSEIGAGAHIGNFVETKKAKLGKGAKANHLTYLGDAEIGEGANIGAGVITCNYDGVHKHMTTIGKDVFVGSDSTLVAPVTIDDGLTSAPAPASPDRARRIARRRPRPPDHQGRLGHRPPRTAARRLYPNRQTKVTNCISGVALPFPAPFLFRPSMAPVNSVSTSLRAGDHFEPKWSPPLLAPHQPMQSPTIPAPATLPPGHNRCFSLPKTLLRSLFVLLN